MAITRPARPIPGVVERLAAWALGVRATEIAPAAVTQDKLLLLDTIGCGFAALHEESARALLAVVDISGGKPQCTVIGRGELTSAANATLANGALVRILDFNDYVNAKAGDLGGHPSDNIPVALAAGELTAATGIEIIAAIVVGYEIFGRCKDLMERDSAWDGVTVSGLAAPAMAGRPAITRGVRRPWNGRPPRRRPATIFGTCRSLPARRSVIKA